MCAEAERLLESYCVALNVFHEARLSVVKALHRADRNLPALQQIKHQAFADLCAARKEYREHLATHGCRGRRRESRSDIEHRLRHEMQAARHNFLAATEQFDLLLGIGLDAPGTADGLLARERAKRLREAAHKRYDEALRRYAEFVIGERDADERTS